MGRVWTFPNNTNDLSLASTCCSVSGMRRRSRQAIAIVSRTPSRNRLAVLGAAYVGVCQTRGASLRAGLIPAPAPTSTASHPRQHAPALKREAGRRFAETSTAPEIWYRAPSANRGTRDNLSRSELLLNHGDRRTPLTCED
jgi:hypothetical protein